MTEEASKEKDIQEGNKWNRIYIVPFIVNVVANFVLGLVRFFCDFDFKRLSSYFIFMSCLDAITSHSRAFNVLVKVASYAYQIGDLAYFSYWNQFLDSDFYAYITPAAILGDGTMVQVVVGSFAILVIGVLVIVPEFFLDKKVKVNITTEIYMLIIWVFSIFMYNFICRLPIMPTNIVIDFGAKTTSSRLRSYFEIQPKVVEKPEKLQNLLIVVLEAFEIDNLGNLSEHCPGSMPYLTSLAENGFYVSNVSISQFQVQTANAMFQWTCGLPYFDGATGAFHIATGRYKCIGDILNEAGYKTIEFNGIQSSKVGGMQKLLRRHHWNFVWRRREHTDDDLYARLKKRLIQLKEADNQPWVMAYLTKMTHLREFGYSKNCKKRIPKTCHKLMDSWDCTDQLLQDFLEYADREKLLDNTQILIFGDHPSAVSELYPKKHRQTFIFPKLPQTEIKRESTIYDLNPSILDLLKIKISPEFPYGASVFGPTDVTPEQPRPEDYPYMYSMTFREKYHS